MKKYLVFLSGCLLLIVDQVSKYYFFNQEIRSKIALFDPSLNTGISFSFAISYALVIPLTIIALFLFVYLYQKKEISAFVAMLLITGTVGNLIDRVLYDGVRDFIVMFDRFIYNCADIYITAGVAIVFWIMLRKQFAIR